MRLGGAAGKHAAAINEKKQHVQLASDAAGFLLYIRGNRRHLPIWLVLGLCENATQIACLRAVHARRAARMPLGGYKLAMIDRH